MNSNILTFEELQKLTHCERMGDVQRHLEKDGIRYFHGRKSIWTTISLVNAAGGIVGEQQQSNERIL